MKFLMLFVWTLTLFLATHATAGEGDFPEINDLELLKRLEKAGEELLKAGTAKGSKDLDAGLKKTEAKFKTPAALKEAIDDRELYKRACESVFVVCGLYRPEDAKEDEWEGAFASAFVVAEDGVLTTSRHFFADPQPCDVFLAVNAKGDIFPVEEILASQEKMDTCLFRIKAEGLKPLPLGSAPVPASRVRVVSHPGYFFYFFSAGQVGNYFKDDDKLRWMNITADFGQGSSGAPVFDDCGNVVGQVTSTLTLYAAGGELVEPLVSRRHFSRKPAAEKKKPADPGAKQPDPKKKEKKKKKPDPKPKPPEEEISDPQMVFKTCTPIEALRGLIQAP